MGHLIEKSNKNNRLWCPKSVVYSACIRATIEKLYKNQLVKPAQKQIELVVVVVVVVVAHFSARGIVVERIG